MWVRGCLLPHPLQRSPRMILHSINQMQSIPTLSPTTSSFLLTLLFLLLPILFLASPSQRPGLIAWLTLFVRHSAQSPFPFPIFRALPILLSSLHYHTITASTTLNPPPSHSIPFVPYSLHL